MSGEERRREIVELLKDSATPISGTALAKKLSVSRQVVVQDMALLRASSYDILSTTKGYVLNEPVKSQEQTRVLKVLHTDEQIEQELQMIVDFGGVVQDVFVQHRIYGTMRADMNIRSRKDVSEFMEHLQNGKSSPLKNITSGYHFHTIAADSEETLNLIEQALRRKGYVIDE